jgi:endonuclease III
MSKKIENIYQILTKELKNKQIPLAEQINIKTKNPFFVLVGTILSARTKDTTTKKVCDRLFKEIKSLEDLEKTSLKKIEKLVYGTGFYKTKAKHLKQLPKTIKEKFSNKIPSTLEELKELPGVGQKTANLVLSVAFNKPAICVDIHVFRITNRIGLVKEKTPEKTEKELKEKIPKKLWKQTNRLFVILGQNICFARNPRCNECPINNYCKKIGVK